MLCLFFAMHKRPTHVCVCEYRLPLYDGLCLYCIGQHRCFYLYNKFVSIHAGLCMCVYKRVFTQYKRNSSHLYCKHYNLLTK